MLSFDKLIESASFVLIEIEWMIFHVSVNPSLVDVLVSEETLDNMIGRIGSRLLEVRWKICLPVSVDEVVINSFIDIYLTCWPFVKIN